MIYLMVIDEDFVRIWVIVGVVVVGVRLLKFIEAKHYLCVLIPI